MEIKIICKINVLQQKLIVIPTTMSQYKNVPKNKQKNNITNYKTNVAQEVNIHNFTIKKKNYFTQ